MLELDHIGIAVRDLDQSIASYQRDFGMKLEFREELKDRGITLAFVTIPGTTIELLAPSNNENIIKKFIDSRGPGLHHLAYRVENIISEMKRLQQLGHELIDTSPRPGARGSKIAFLHPKTFGGVLIELVQI